MSGVFSPCLSENDRWTDIFLKKIHFSKNGLFGQFLIDILQKRIFLSTRSRGLIWVQLYPLRCHYKSAHIFRICPTFLTWPLLPMFYLCLSPVSDFFDFAWLQNDDFDGFYFWHLVNYFNPFSLHFIFAIFHLLL